MGYVCNKPKHNNNNNNRTKVNGSNVPILDAYLDNNAVEIPVGEAYQALSGSIPTAILKTYYVDEGMRITRDIDENIFVFTRA